MLVPGWVNALGEGRGTEDGESPGLSSKSLVRVNCASALRQKTDKDAHGGSRAHRSGRAVPLDAPPAKYSRALAHARAHTHLQGGVLFCLRCAVSILEARDNAGIARIFQPTALGDSFFFSSLFFLLFKGLAEAAAREEKLHLAGRDAARRVEGRGG